MRRLLWLLALCLAGIPSAAGAQVFQQGGVIPQHLTMWSTNNAVRDGGGVAQMPQGQQPFELGIVAPPNKTGNPFPAVSSGKGPNGENFCIYDSPLGVAGHYLCFSPNNGGNAVISTGSSGGATPGGFMILINGTLYPFPGAGSGNVVGPATSVIGDVACWNNTLGSLLKDCGVGLFAANNLSDLTNPGTARTNLGLGTMATQNANNVAVTGGTMANVAVTGGTVSGLTSPLATASGGTGLSSSGPSGDILTSNGTSWTASPFPTGVPSNQAVTVTGALGINSSNAVNYCGKTIQAGGGAFYSISLAAPTGFPASCLITVTNADNRGKTMQVTGLNSRILWPGHTVAYAINGSLWSANPGTEPRFAVDCSVYPALCPLAGSGYSAFINVDSVSGNDSNDCLSTGSGACATLSGAAHLLYSSFDFGNGGYPVINIGPAGATLPGNVFQGPFPGAAVLFIVCANNVTLTPTSNGVVLQGSDGATMEIGYNAGGGGCKVDGNGVNGSTGIFAHQNIIDMNSVTFGTFPNGVHMFADNNASLHINMSYIVAGSATDHVVVGPSSVLTNNGATTVTFQGTPAINTLYTISGAGSFISLGAGITYSGALTLTTQCSITGPAAISRNSNTLPTATNGCLVSNGGQAY